MGPRIICLSSGCYGPATVLDTLEDDRWVDTFHHSRASASVGMGIKFCGTIEGRMAKFLYRCEGRFHPGGGMWGGSWWQSKSLWGKEGLRNTRPVFLNAAWTVNGSWMGLVLSHNLWVAMWAEVIITLFYGVIMMLRVEVWVTPGFFSTGPFYMTIRSILSPELLIKVLFMWIDKAFRGLMSLE